MNEKFLSYIWQFKLFQWNEMTTENRLKIEVIKSGLLNTNSGPDFINSQLIIDGIKWVGNIEIHVNSSDWYKHNHHKDKAYNNVILHVVYNKNDGETICENGNVVPVYELRNNISEEYLRNFNVLNNSSEKIPCTGLIQNMNPFKTESFKPKLLIERLERKSNTIYHEWINCGKDWNQVIFITLSKYFGQKLNQLPFEQLAKSIDFKLLLKNKHNQDLIEAFIFGQAGFLNNNFNDDYPNKLKKDYAYIKQKYSLVEMEYSWWKFLRLRPASFPTIRLAQLSSFIYNLESSLFDLLFSESTKDIIKAFKYEPNDYWLNHYNFDLQSNRKKKVIGDNTIEVLIINAIIPVMFTYAKSIGKEDLIEKSINFYSQIKAERNKIIDDWNNLNIICKTAYDSQSLIELRTEYCNKKKCMDCQIGHAILKSTNK